VLESPLSLDPGRKNVRFLYSRCKMQDYRFKGDMRNLNTLEDIDKIFNEIALIAHHGSNSEDVTVVALGGVVFGNVREVC
jgi:hypothetical protein